MVSSRHAIGLALLVCAAISATGASMEVEAVPNELTANEVTSLDQKEAVSLGDGAADTEQVGWGAVTGVSHVVISNSGGIKRLGSSLSPTKSASLMDVVPLWKAIAISNDRFRRSGVYLGCIFSVKKFGFAKVCARKKCKYTWSRRFCGKVEAHKKKTKWGKTWSGVKCADGSRPKTKKTIKLGADGKPIPCTCARYLLSPLTGKFPALWASSQKKFCKYNPTSCDATICYKFPGPTQGWGKNVKVKSPGYYELKNKITSIRIGEAMMEVQFSMGASLEKVAFCEKIFPPKMIGGVMRSKDCRAFKKCAVPPGSVKGPGWSKKMKCMDLSTASSKKIDCPETNPEFKKKMTSRVNDILDMVCSKI